MAQAKDADEGFVPFDVGTAGASASIKFHVSGLYKTQSRQIYFRILPPESGWPRDSGFSGFPYGSMLKELMKEITGIDYSDFLDATSSSPKIFPHDGLKLRVVWADENTKTIIKEGVVVRDKSGGKGAALSEFALDYFLPPSTGDYMVTVSTDDGDHRFESFRTGIFLGNIGWFRK